MSAPTTVTEIVTFSGNEQLKKDPSLFVPFVEIFEDKASPGRQGQVWGSRIEEPGVFQILVDWDSLEHYKKVQDEQSLSSDAIEPLAKLLVEPPKKIYVPFRPIASYAKAVAAPVTEMAFFRRKDEVDPQVLKDVVDALMADPESVERCIGAAWGCSVEDEATVVLLLGWKSIEAHRAFANSEKFETMTGSFRECVTRIEMFHVAFQ